MHHRRGPAVGSGQRRLRPQRLAGLALNAQAAISSSANTQPAADAALLAILRRLSDLEYRFITPTPATHARVLKQPGRRKAQDLRDVFGWSLPFDPAVVPGDMLELMRIAGILEGHGRRLRSALRVSSLGDLLFLHSAYPTTDKDAVFFGPDSYRFAAFIDRNLPRGGPAIRRLADIGAGAGVGAISAGVGLPDTLLVLTDVNPAALRLSRINAEAAGVAIATVQTDGLDGVDDPIDVAIANPPYIIDSGDRDYRDGGGMHGGQVSLDMAAAALDRLAPGGRLLLYTGSAIVGGRDELGAALRALSAERGCAIHYGELDPDVFGEELTSAAYADVERIAVVGAVIVKP